MERDINQAQEIHRQKKKKNSIMELEGLGANIWKGIDAQDYVHKERESSYISRVKNYNFLINFFSEFLKFQKKIYL